jgi:hypothetical protein
MLKTTTNSRSRELLENDDDFRVQIIFRKLDDVECSIIMILKLMISVVFTMFYMERIYSSVEISSTKTICRSSRQSMSCWNIMVILMTPINFSCYPSRFSKWVKKMKWALPAPVVGDVLSCCPAIGQATCSGDRISFSPIQQR